MKHPRNINPLRLVQLGLLLLLTAFLAGCNHNPPQVVIQTEIVYITVPDEMTQKVKPEPPIAKSAYLAMEIYDREQYLAQYTVRLLKNLHQCNAQLESIKVLQEPPK